MAEKWLHVDTDNSYIELGNKGVKLNLWDGEHVLGELRIRKSGIAFSPKKRGGPYYTCSWADLTKKLDPP
jgi:hypothetical protein